MNVITRKKGCKLKLTKQLLFLSLKIKADTLVALIGYATKVAGED